MESRENADFPDGYCDFPPTVWQKSQACRRLMKPSPMLSEAFSDYTLAEVRRGEWLYRSAFRLFIIRKELYFMKNMKNLLKKGLSLVLALMLCLTVSTFLVACQNEEPENPKDTEETETQADLSKLDEPTRTLEVYKLVEANMDALKSYVTEMEINMTGIMEGQNVTVKGTNETVLYDIGGENYAYYSETDTKVTLTDLKVTVTNSSVEGFQDGKMFAYEESNGTFNKLWSPIAVSEYVKFQDSRENDDFNVEDLALTSAETAAVRSSVQKEDGGWELTYSSFSEKAMEQLAKIAYSFTGEDASDFTIDDVILTLTASSDFYCQGLKLDFVFQKAESGEAVIPTLSLEATYRDLGTAAAKKVDLSDYTEVGDLRIYYTVKQELDRMLEEGGYFKMSLTNRVTYASQTDSYSEKNTGEWRFENDKLVYDISHRTGDQTGDPYLISYRDGKQTVQLGDQKNEVDSTDAREKAFLMGLFDIGALSLINIKNIDLRNADNGNYEITLISPDFSNMDATIAQIQGTVEKVTGRITVTIENGKLVAYRYVATLEASSYNGTLKVNINASCEFSSDTPLALGN